MFLFENFQGFLHRNVYTYQHYKSMYQFNNRYTNLHGTANRHKLINIQEINKEKLNFSAHV